MFGEVSMYLNATVGLMNSAANTIESAVANTSLVANTTGVPNYRLIDLTIANQNTVSSNVNITVQTSLYRPAIDSPAFDLKIKFPSVDYDLVLEHDNAGIGVESAGDTIGFETVTGGTLVLDDGSSKIQLEEYFDSIVQENESNLELEESLTSKNYLLEEPTTESTQLISEDYHDSFNFVLEEDGNDYLIEQEGTEYSYILGEDGTTRIMGIDYLVEALRITLEIEDISKIEFDAFTQKLK